MMAPWEYWEYQEQRECWEYWGVLGGHWEPEEAAGPVAMATLGSPPEGRHEGRKARPLARS